MNLLKLMTVGCLLSCFSGLMTSCSDDDDAGSKVLLRPVTAMEIVQNKAYLSWKSVEGATALAEHKVTLGDDVTGLVSLAHAGVDVDAVKRVAEQTQGEVSLDSGVLGNGAP